MTTLPHDTSTSGMRRGACPALSTPMKTGDGLLARIALTHAISPADLTEICRLAVVHGNGVIDISARGNLQVRGLTDASAPRIDAEIRKLNLPLRDGLAVETPPLAGFDAREIADPRPLADAIRQVARDIGGLAPKTSVVVDGHGQLRHSHLIADIRIVAAENGNWTIILGGTEETGHVFNVLRETLVVDPVLDLLIMLSSLGNEARGRDLASRSPAVSAYKQHAHPLQVRATDQAFAADTAAASPFGLFVLRNGLHAVGLGPAFGQTQASILVALSEEATRLGIKSVKPALDHSLLFFGKESACSKLRSFADRSGFVVQADDPRGHVASCAGSPACTSATVATHSIAERAAIECADLLDGSFKLHVTGCAKGCAHPSPSALTLCGTTNGISLIAQGKAAGAPFAFSAFADTNATLRRLSDLVKSERRPGENSAACLARIGSARLAAVATGRP